MPGKTVTDAVHGSIAVEGVALDLLESLELQRLNGIRQLGLTNLVFPGANHTRLEHVLGAYQVAGEMARSLSLPHEEAALVSTAALLHDLGHGPFSHTLERVLAEATGLDHMEITKRIIRGEEDSVPGPERSFFAKTPTVPDVLEEWAVPKEDLADLITGGGVSGLLAFEGRDSAPAKPYLHQIIHGVLDADQIDFLLRDAFYTGVAHGIIDLPRLLSTFRLADGNLVIDRKGLSAVEGTLVARGLMYTSVYFHKTVRIAETMLARAVERAPKKPEELFLMNDAELMSWLLAQEGHIRETALRLKYRKLYKRVLSRDTAELTPDERARLVELSVPERRMRAEESVCQRLGLPRGKVIIDIPAPEILLTEPRISRVDLGVLEDGQVRPFRRVSSLARALQVRETVEWAVMVAADPAHASEVERVAPKVLFA